jgi:hypothetical protein
MAVAAIATFKKARHKEREAHLRRLALQIVVQLPADPQEALDCLELAKDAVRAFLVDPRPV